MAEINWEHWLRGEGLPDFDLALNIDDSLLRRCRVLADAWLARPLGEERCPTDLNEMKAQQIMLFLDYLTQASDTGKFLSEEVLAEMEDLYSLSTTQNVEIAFRWCLLGCKCRWDACLPTVEAFLAVQGRGVYVTAIYRAFHAFNPTRAVQVFERNRAFYMEVISAQISNIVGVP